MEYANSLRTVEMTSPPRGWGWKWSNRNITLAALISAGAGKRKPASRPNAHAATGRPSSPVAVTSLKATSLGNTAPSNAIATVGNGK